MVVLSLVGCGPSRGEPPAHDSADRDSPDTAVHGDTADTADTAPAPRDIVILFTFDTVRQESFNPTDMPNVMALASEGIWFPEVWQSGPWTYTGCSAINSGHSPADAGPGAFDPTGSLPTLPESVVTLGELAAAAGVDAGFYSQNATCGDATNQAQGWDYTGDVAGDALVSGGLDWLDSHASGKALLWLHSFGGHDPYDALDPSCMDAAEAVGTDCPYDLSSAGEGDYNSVLNEMNAEYRRRPGRAWWPDCDARVRAWNSCQVTRADAAVPDLLAGLDERGLLDRVTLVFLPDHGEGWDVSHEAYNHNNNLLAPVTRGAAVVWQSGTTPRTIEEPVSQLDIFPTVADLLDLDPGDVPGVSLVGEIPTDRVLPQFWCGSAAPGGSVSRPVSGGYLSARHYIRDTSLGIEELYDTVGDPLEHHNLVGTEAVPEALETFVTAQDEATAGVCGSG